MEIWEGLSLPGDDFDKAIERFHLMEVAKQGRIWMLFIGVVVVVVELNWLSF